MEKNIEAINEPVSNGGVFSNCCARRVWHAGFQGSCMRFVLKVLAKSKGSLPDGHFGDRYSEQLPCMVKKLGSPQNTIIDHTS